MSGFDVLGLGAVAVDELIYVEGFPPPDVKTRVSRIERQCGGLTATALVAGGQAGIPTLNAVEDALARASA